MSGQSSSSATAVQFLYQVVYALWGLSYLPEARTEMVTSKVGVVTKLVEILRGVQKEKVVRVALACLRNLLVADTAASDMVAAGIVKVLVGLQQRKMADEDIPQDVEYMYNTLQARDLPCPHHVTPPFHIHHVTHTHVQHAAGEHGDDVEFRRVQEGVDGRQARVVAVAQE